MRLAPSSAPVGLKFRAVNWSTKLKISLYNGSWNVTITLQQSMGTVIILFSILSPAVLAEGFRGVPQSIQVNRGHGRFLWHSLKFIIHYYRSTSFMCLVQRMLLSGGTLESRTVSKLCSRTWILSLRKHTACLLRLMMSMDVYFENQTHKSTKGKQSSGTLKQVIHMVTIAIYTVTK
jgi:hypothetical protein